MMVQNRKHNLLKGLVKLKKRVNDITKETQVHENHENYEYKEISIVMSLQESNGTEIKLTSAINFYIMLRATLWIKMRILNINYGGIYE